MSDQDKRFEFPSKQDRYLSTLSKFYEKEDQKHLQEIIVNSKASVNAGWHYDNWNGGIHGHILFLAMPEFIYLKYINDKDELQNSIKDGINKIIDISDEYIHEVLFKMDDSEENDWRKDSQLLISNKKIVPDKVTDRIWDDNTYRVFLSHKTEVKKETSELKENLKLYGISCFVAHEDIQPTEEWQNEIENALHTMDAFVAILTHDFHDSLWTDQEVGFAFGRGVPIISVKIERDPYGFIGKFQALKCTWENADFEIVKLLIKKETMVSAYINAVKNCQTYENGNKLSELLPFIEKLSDKQVEDIIEAFNTNSQVFDSYGFNGKNPQLYGNGLPFYLNTLTKNRYKINAQRAIIRD